MLIHKTILEILGRIFVQMKTNILVLGHIRKLFPLPKLYLPKLSQKNQPKIKIYSWSSINSKYSSPSYELVNFKIPPSKTSLFNVAEDAIIKNNNKK